MKYFFVFAILTLYFDPSLCNNWESCGIDWEPYKDEKCFQILEDDHPTQSFESAIEKCASLGDTSTLVNIDSIEEQTFLSNFLFKIQKKSDNFWIGAKYSNNFYKWLDNSKLSFTNWDLNYPNKNVDHLCVEMQAKESVAGKWKNAPCEMRNAVVCQKMQFWSIDQIQKTVLKQKQTFSVALNDANKKIQSLKLNLEKAIKNPVRREEFSIALNEAKKNILINLNLKEADLKQKLSKVTQNQHETKNQLTNAENKIVNLEKNPVPIGFIYVQLSNQPEPKTLWPTVQWNDVTSEYAGLFFRAEGKGSAKFGTVQAENAPRVTEVRKEYYFWHSAGNTWDSTTLTPGGKSSGYGIFSGVGNAFDGFTHRFYQSGGEVRPRNIAMRVWKISNNMFD